MKAFAARRSYFACGCVVFTIILSAVDVSAQGPGVGANLPMVTVPDGPVVLPTAEQPRIRVVPITKGLSHPWSLAFLPNGDILVTERDKATLRVISDGVLDPNPIPGVPEAYTSARLAGLMEVAIHPNDGQLVYLTYCKPVELDGRLGSTVALARGRLDAGALTEVRDIFVAEGWGNGIAASRLAFGADGKLYMTVGGAIRSSSTGKKAQDPSNHFGKVLRLNDDGTAPNDNPFVGRIGYLPEIYSMGHRNQLGLVFHPDTGELWASENGPQGADEVNIVRAGSNYGWPVATDSREYSGRRTSDTPWLDAFVRPEILWQPSIGPSGLAFYSGERFPAWQGNLFVGSMRVGQMERTGHLERIVFSRRGEEIRREWLLTEFKQRIRDVRQGPDGFIYVLTEEFDGALLRIEPAEAITEPPGSVQPIRRLRTPRITPLPEEQWTDAQRTLARRYVPNATLGNALRTLIRVPGLADRVFPLLNYIENGSTLMARHREILILRTAWLTQNASLWATHASHASEAGLSEEALRGIAEGRFADGWVRFEMTLMDLAQELFRNSSVTQRTWDALSEEYSLHNLLDAVTTVSEIIAQSILFNSLGIQPDDDTTAVIPTSDFAYRVYTLERDAPLTEPRIEPTEGSELRFLRTLSQHPELAKAWNMNSAYVMNSEPPPLEPRERELLILRTGWNTQSVYEWAKHVGSVGLAREHGLDPLWIAQGSDASGWDENDLTLITAANEMYRDTIISDQTWEKLSTRYSTEEMMSITMAVARARRASMVFNAVGVQPLGDDELFPVVEGYERAWWIPGSRQ